MYADRIKQIRKKLDLSISKLSKKIEVPERTIGSYERDERSPSLDFLARLCKFLNVNPYWFLTGEGDMFNQPVLNTEKEFTQKVEAILRKNNIIS